MNRIVQVLLIAGGVIHLLPVPGVMGARALERLYGMTFEHPDLLVLMRHRAVLFGLLGAFLVVAAFRPALQVAAIAAGLVNAVAFVALAWGTGEHGAAIDRVVLADLIAIACLVAAAALRRVRLGQAGRRSERS